MFWDILKVTIYEHVEKQAEAYLLQKKYIKSMYRYFQSISLTHPLGTPVSFFH